MEELEDLTESESERDRLARTAMFGLISHYGWNHPPKLIATKAYEYADAMLEASDGN